MVGRGFTHPKWAFSIASRGVSIHSNSSFHDRAKFSRAAPFAMARRPAKVGQERKFVGASQLSRRGAPASRRLQYSEPKMTPEESQANQSILDGVEAVGGGYVWDAEVFAVTLMDVSLADDKVIPLCGLRGIQQIALDASRLSIATIAALAGITGLQSLVLARRTFTEGQRNELSRLGPQIVEVDD
ncbi:hypothetical protein FQZ97_914890 [compost metagenome]